MPVKNRDSSPERRRTSLGKDKEKESSKKHKSERRDRDKPYRRSSDKEGHTSRTSSSPTRHYARFSMPGTTASATKFNGSAESKASLPYPSFSKQHSKEAVGSREVIRPVLNIFTPPATDVNASKERVASNYSVPCRNAPPSPPLTDQNAGISRSNSGKRVEVETVIEEDRTSSRESKLHTKVRPRSSKSPVQPRSSAEAGSNVTVPKTRAQDRVSTPLKSMDQSTLPHHSGSQPNHRLDKPARAVSPPTNGSNAGIITDLSSNATSIAPEQLTMQRPGSKAPLGGVHNLESQNSPVEIDARNDTPLERIEPDEHTPNQFPPPPPPPPPDIPVNIPKVDYLLQHGGLNQVVPRNLLLAGKPMAVQQAAMSPAQMPAMMTNLFEPYNQLLDDFENVMTKHGSLAVATGYRSVARRLLDRLEAVFARDISSEVCECSMCTCYDSEMEDNRSVNWGEILEMVSGRRELPAWPPFSMCQSPVGLGISSRMEAPMQKLDVDVPEEYRDHYIRQSKKTKQSVDIWLNRQTEGSSSPPEEFDDETLTFAMLTYLPVDQRATFCNLLGIKQGPIEPPRRAPSPDRNGPPRPASIVGSKPRQQAIISTSAAIEKLYRLAQPPRDPETAIFMLNNPSLHNALATLAAISSDEWEILVSGRFDGFLRSGADDLSDLHSTRQTPHQPSSRNSTPAHFHGLNGSNRKPGYPSRGPTPANAPAQYGAPVAFDEETEIATLAEIERDIYVGMEKLEDAFETLHQKAEVVRKALRERSAGLAAAAQRRRGLSWSPEVRGGTPASLSGYLNGDRWDNETDDGLGDWDGVSELAPDDSASNISSSRRRRPKRRNERRTPAPVAEEDESESYAESDGTASPKKTGRYEPQR